MPKDLQTTLRQLADDFATGVIAALRAASLEELRGGTPHQGSVRQASARSVSARPNRSGRPRQTSLRPVEPRITMGADDLLDKMVETARKFPAGLRSEEFRAVLKLDDKNLFRHVANEAVAAKLLNRTGEKRATTYFPI